MWTGYLPFQHDQLLTQEHVFRDQVAFTSCEISQGTCYLACFGWLRPLFEPYLKPGHTVLYDLAKFVLHKVDDQDWLTFEERGCPFAARESRLFYLISSRIGFLTPTGGKPGFKEQLFCP